MAKIDPTVCRMILFHPPANSTHGAFAPSAICAAVIANVLPDGRLNLAVFDGNGASHPMTEVPLIQEGDKPPVTGYYAEWMPYQKSVAKGEAPPVLHAPPPPIPPAPVVIPAPKSAEDLPLSAAAHPVTTV